MKYRQLICVLVGLCLIGITLDLTPQSAAAQQCDYFASPDGRGNGLSESSPFQISNFLSMAESEIRGKTLCLLDGTYHSSLTISKSGTASQPITIRALHDGEVTIDGEYSRSPASISGNYIIIEGIVFQKPSNHVVEVSGSHNIFRRCSAYRGLFGGNEHCWLITGTYNLLEDCVAAGTDRHLFLDFNSSGRAQYNVFRRCFGAGDQLIGSNDPADSDFNLYGASNDIVENCIGWGGTKYASFSIHSASWTDSYRCRNNKVFGSIMMNSRSIGSDPGLGLIVSAARGVENALDNYIENSVIYGNTYGARIEADSDNTILNHCTIISNQNYGLSAESSSAIVKNTLIYNNRAGITSAQGAFSHINVYGNNSSNNLPSNCQDCISQNPGINNSVLVIPANSPLKGAGENGSDIGANICYRYENGLLTNIPLWPWPMADRIKKELGIDVMAELEQLFGPVPAECKGEGPKEDINLDGSINSLDLQLCVNVLTGRETVADIVKRADVNGDGIVDEADIELIIRRILDR